MGLTLVRTLPEDEWRNFVEKHPEGNIFHTPEMFQVFSRSKNYAPELWAITKNGRVLALFLPVQRTLMGKLLRIFTTRSVVYGSVLCMPDAEGQEALSVLLERYTHEVNGGPLFTEVRNLSNLSTIQPIMAQYGFVYQEYLNFLINLKRTPMEIFGDFGRRTRKNLRRGLRGAKIVIEDVNEREQVDACYDLISKSYRVARVPLVDRSFFKTAFDILHPKGMVLFTLARVAQKPVAASVELLYKDIIYGWYGGMDRVYSAYIPNELLMWHILKWGSEKGYRLYDWGGAGSPDEEYGVRDFKAKFGGELVCFGRNICVHSPVRLKLSKLGYGILRRLFLRS